MDFPGVLARDSALLAKIAAARRRGKPVDGHAPGLRGATAAAYAAAGISTDHECATLAEARDKIAAGMRILIREGSAAKNFAALAPLLKTHPARCMFCCDDLHPDRLLLYHIDAHIRRALASGADRYDVLGLRLGQSGAALRPACRPAARRATRRTSSWWTTGGGFASSAPTWRDGSWPPTAAAACPAGPCGW